MICSPESEGPLRDQLLSPQELAESLDLSPSTLSSWRCENRGPCYLKIGRKIWYPKNRVNEWVENQLRETNDANSKKGRPLAFPVQVGRKDIYRKNRLGRHKTKHDAGAINRE